MVAMNFSRAVFRIAGVGGLLTILPMFFLLERFGRDNPPPVTHPEFFYGFAGVTLAWQIVFLIVASDPARLRPIIPAAVVEKLAWAGTVAVLWSERRISSGFIPVGAVDLVLAILFSVAFAKTAGLGGSRAA